MNEKEVELLEYLVRNAAYTSNDWGKNEFKIDYTKSLKENLEKLIEIVGENAYANGEYSERS